MNKDNWTLNECLERVKRYANGEEQRGKHGYYSAVAEYLEQLKKAKLIMTGVYCVGDITKEEGMQQLAECLKEE